MTNHLPDRHELAFDVHPGHGRQRLHLPSRGTDRVERCRCEQSVAFYGADQEGGASLDLDQHIYRDGELLTRGWVQLACLDTVTYKPRALPSPVHAKLNAWKMP